MSAPPFPLAELRVVEIALGTSAVTNGMAGSLPGLLMRDFGADVVHVRSVPRSTLDAGVQFDRVWNDGKEIVEVNGDPAWARATIAALVKDADVVFLTGGEDDIERNGLGYRELASVNPRLVHVRIRPSVDSSGAIADAELLVAARAGLLTQIRGHRPGPIFPVLPVANAGAALAATVGALAGLYERDTTGAGSWAETSLYDGLQAILPMIIGRVERPTASTRLLWENQGPAETLAYRCADGEYIQLWFGAKGAYEAFLERMGEPPSETGYRADLLSGAMGERSVRWEQQFATHDRSWWMSELAGHAFRCEPVLRPGEALLDGHVREVGLSIGSGGIKRVGPVARVTPVGDAGVPPAPGGRLLTGVKVLDLAAYLAGPITPLILAELGADVVKVEPPSGDAHRGMEHMFAAGQRGKRSVAVDMKAPDAAVLLERLFRWADVVHHNSRIGLAERLGYDEATVRAANPNVVYSFASGFGTSGPRAPLAANDHLMQALSGVEGAQGGDGRPPTFLVWGAIDVASGWLSACAVLAGLYARRRTGAGQSVNTSLLGAALLLESGAFVEGDRVVAGPVLDREQTGYGAAYRVYRCADDEWLALAVTDEATWSRLRSAVRADDLPASPPPLRTGTGELQPAEKMLEDAFVTAGAATWVARLRAAQVPAEAVVQCDRATFIARLLDDPVNQQLGRVASYEWEPVGKLEQPGLPLRLGPEPRPQARRSIAALGEHTDEVLDVTG